MIFLFSSLFSDTEDSMFVDVLDRQRPCAVFDLVNSNEVVGEFEHVRAQGNDDKLSIFCAFLGKRNVERFFFV